MADIWIVSNFLVITNNAALGTLARLDAHVIVFVAYITRSDTAGSKSVYTVTFSR